MKQSRRLVLSAACVALASPPALAQPYPSKPIRAIVPSGAAGSTNIAARTIGDAIGRTLGQPVVVDNRPGADGIIGMEACARAAPDGYTICFGQPAPLSIVPFVNAKLPYDAERDFAPVILVMVQSDAIVANASLPASSLRDLVELAKSRPGAINWGTWGSSSFSNLYLAWVQNRGGVRFNHVPYKTPDQAQAAVLAGEVSVMLVNARIALPQIQAGKLKALAITGNLGTSVLPGVPSFVQAGFDLDFRGWVGVLAPAKTPAPVVTRLNREIGAVIADPAFLDKLQGIVTVETVGGTPEAFGSFLRANRETAGRLVKLAGVEPN